MNGTTAATAAAGLYLAESYWPGVSEPKLLTAARRVVDDSAASCLELVPADEIVLCLPGTVPGGRHGRQPPGGSAVRTRDRGGPGQPGHGRPPSAASRRETLEGRGAQPDASPSGAERRTHTMTTSPSTISTSRRVRRLTLAAAAFVAALAVVPQALATYPGHNGLITFSANTGSGSQLYTVRANGNDLRQVAPLLAGDAINPDWSPDGRTIAFELDTDVSADVELIRPDGGGLVNLTAGVCCSGQPSFTPDGKQIVFERFDLNTFDDGIWIMNADGSNQRPLIDPWPDGTGFATDPNVSPDGTTLSFVGFDNSLFGPPPALEPAQGLFTSGIDGSLTSLRQLLPFSADLAIKQDWAPDGKRLLVGVNANFFQPDKPSNIGTIKTDGSDFTPLTSFQDRAVSAFAGSYSPDGNWVVLRIEDHGQYGLFRMHADGGKLHEILPLSNFRPRFIDWGPRTPNNNDGDESGDGN
jgi:WD40 repeat protein